jgi:sugar O-acyltransferase (sialic acid O-acetyltransferase NeuD family)
MGKTAVTQGNGVRAHSAATASTPAPPGALAPDVSRILIVGAGGFGREVLQWVRDAWPRESSKILGFLASDPQGASPHTSHPPIVGRPDEFLPEPGDAFLLAIGIPVVRRRVGEQLERRGAFFLTLVHPTAIVASTASIGHGSILCPYAVVSDSVQVGSFSLLNYHASLGHDSKTGDFSVLSPYATLGGGAEIGPDSFLGLHASVGPRVRLGSHSKVSANSAALHDAPAQSLVFGVPGRTIFGLDTAETSGEKRT